MHFSSPTDNRSLVFVVVVDLIKMEVPVISFAGSNLRIKQSILQTVLGYVVCFISGR